MLGWHGEMGLVTKEGKANLWQCGLPFVPHPKQESKLSFCVLGKGSPAWLWASKFNPSEPQLPHEYSELYSLPHSMVVRTSVS